MTTINKILGCAICEKELEFCSCNDIDNRIRKAKNDPEFVFKICERCDRHYSRCKCLMPKWTTSWDCLTIEELEEFIIKQNERRNKHEG